MQRIVFVNLHANPFLLRNLNSFIWKQSCALKHKYFLDYLIENTEVEVCNYINKKGFTLVRSFPKPIQAILDRFSRIEHFVTLRKNGIPRKSIKLITNKKDIKPNDIVIGYSSVPNSVWDMDEITSFKAISNIHFFGFQRESDMLRKANPDIMFNECDLSKYSEVFKRYYGWYKNKYIVHCFVAAPRFKNSKPFSKRETKCFSTGTITYRTHDEQLAVYKTSCIQPTRKQVMDNKVDLEPLVACYNSDYLEDNTLKKYLPTDGFFKHLYKVWYNSTHCAQQKKYFSFNMVDKFNDFKMCLVGEEILGAPGIGFTEGMSCGCAYIGQTLGYYEDYGMQEGVHYIGYDGTLDGLKSKITYYQRPENQDALEAIANNGCEFAREHFSGPIAAEDLLNKLLKAHTDWLNNKQ